MPWNPEIYNQSKDIRYKPFYDLTELISEYNLRNAIDIGCGTGEQTHILSQKFPDAKFLGIDPSAEMLSKANAFESKNLSFKTETVENFIASTQKWDLIFSNAALQWADDHTNLFPKILARLNTNGQLAVQMPVQKENLLNKLLLDLVQEEPFCNFLKGWKRESPVLSIDEYAQLLFDNGLHDIQIIQKVYPIIANNEDELFNFISGSALIPYIERLNTDQQQLFTSAYKNKIEKEFKKFPAIYAFKRLLLYGKK